MAVRLIINTMPYTSLSFVTLVPASLTISTFAATSSPTLAEKVTNRHYEIHIINGFTDSDKPLIIHCLSKDGYLGVHTLWKDREYNWDFGLSIGRALAAPATLHGIHSSSTLTFSMGVR